LSSAQLPNKCATITGGGFLTSITGRGQSSRDLAEARNKLRIGYGGGDGTKPSTTPVDLKTELKRILTNGVVNSKITNHVRASLVCVLDQLSMLLKATNACHGGNDCFVTTAPATNYVAGKDVATKKKSILYAIDVLKKTTYTDGAGSDALRRADILRVVSFAGFLGHPFWVNCKSGLDRTGIFAAVSAAYNMMLSSSYLPNTVAGSLSEHCVPYLSYLASDFEHVGDLKDKDAGTTTTCTHFTGSKAMTLDDFKNGGGIYVLREFRKLTLEIAMKQSIPISFLSTGTLGVKWKAGSYGIYDQIVKYFLPDDVDGSGGKPTFTQSSGYRAS